MNKTELIEHIANNADISKAAAARALESTIEAVKKTLTIPKWLNDKAEREQINFSQLLQAALRQKLGL